MPPKRGRPNKKFTGPARKKQKLPSVSAMRKLVVQQIGRNLETKRSTATSSDGPEIGHNNFIVLDSNVLETNPGATDPMVGAASNRIGDEITLRGVSIKMMVELNERYSDVTFRLFVVKKAKGDTLSAVTFFTGLSGNKMIDTINTERFTVMYSKTFKLTARNQGTVGAGDQSGLSSGINVAHGDAHTVLTRATKIVKVYIPGKRFRAGGKIIYENGSSQPKFFDYQVILFGYSNYTTSALLGFNVGRLNDYVREIYYKDA